jgi:hypothetical protein
MNLSTCVSVISLLAYQVAYRVLTLISVIHLYFIARIC